MLSVKVFTSGGHLHTAPRVRHVGPPLSLSSCHTKATRRWPLLFLKSLEHMTTSPSDLPDELHKFQSRLEAHLMPQQLLTRVQRDVDCSLSGTRRPRFQVRSRTTRDTMWLPLRFHCLWQKGSLAHSLTKLVSEPDMIRAYCTAFERCESPSLRVAWKAAAPGWQSILRRKPRLEVG